MAILSLVKTSAFTIERLQIIFFNVIIFLVLGVGILWGRSQRQKEVNKLNNNIERLKQEKEIAEMNASAGTIANAPKSNISFPPEDVLQKSNIQFHPEQSQPHAPIASIYDNPRDPDDFNGKEKENHPHEKIYPARGQGNILSQGWQIIGASRREVDPLLWSP